MTPSCLGMVLGEDPGGKSSSAAYTCGRRGMAAVVGGELAEFHGQVTYQKVNLKSSTSRFPPLPGPWE